MNKLPHPVVDDRGVLESLADNEAVGSHPHLLEWVEAIAAGYDHYRASAGNALQIANVPLTDQVKGYLKGHYSSPPKGLEHISLIRRQHRHRLCPMCGSMHSGTLDHVLPKEDYSEFAIFSLNLVPACDCNIKRGRTTTGRVPGARVLHPYFDECLSERLISAHFEDLGPVPRVSLRILVDNTHQHYQAISFHVAEIVGNTGVLEYLSDSWTSLCEMPEQVVRALGEIPATLEDLQAALGRELEMLDGHHKGRNNWNSVFVHGLMDNEVLNWLFARLTAPGREPRDPLL
jgi:hypothetical protein